MKKTLLLLSAIAMLVTSCGKKDEFTISGKLPNATFDGKQVYLQEIDSTYRNPVKLDSTIIKNGTFEFKGTVNKPLSVRFVALAEPIGGIERPAILILESGKIDLAFDSISTVKGTKANDAYQIYATKQNAINGDLKNIYEESRKDTANVALQEAFEQNYQKLDEQRTKELYAYTKSNIKNPIGVYLFLSNSYLFDLDQLKDFLATMNPQDKQNAKAQEIQKRVDVLDATAVGKTFTDIKGLNPAGKEIALSEVAGKGKIVLVDFWASWCPPCRAEMPGLVALYKKYKGKDFEIVGVSLDHDKEAWMKGIKTLGITWAQMSDLKGWDSELSGAYGVSSIPHTVLIDKDGKILAKNLGAMDLSGKLDELLKKK